MADTWDVKRQVGELVGELRSLRTGQSIQLPHGIKIGIIAVGRGNASRERRFAVIRGEQREIKRSATEAAVAGMDMCKSLDKGN